jgi:hypothetical protein
MVKELHGHFPALFDPPIDEGEDGEDAPRAGEEAGSGGGGVFAPYGITPFVITYCKLTNTPIMEVYRQSVTHLFYIVSYETVRRRQENEELKKYRKGYA